MKIPLIGKPPLRCANKAELDERRVDPVIDEAVRELLDLKAVQPMPRNAKVFLSSVPKTERGKEYGMRFILNLKVSLLHTSWISIGPHFYAPSQNILV